MRYGMHETVHSMPPNKRLGLLGDIYFAFVRYKQCHRNHGQAQPLGTGFSGWVFICVQQIVPYLLQHIKLVRMIFKNLRLCGMVNRYSNSYPD